MGDRPDVDIITNDIQPAEAVTRTKKDFAQTRRDFQQIKVLNKYGNIQGAFLGVGAQSPISGGAPIRKSPSPPKFGTVGA